MQCFSAAHAFDYIALMINPCLTSCKDLATVVDICLHNNYSACNASYVLPYRCMFGKICASTIVMHGYTYKKGACSSYIAILK